MHVARPKMERNDDFTILYKSTFFFFLKDNTYRPTLPSLPGLPLGLFGNCLSENDFVNFVCGKINPSIVQNFVLEKFVL